MNVNFSNATLCRKHLLLFLSPTFLSLLSHTQHGCLKSEESIGTSFQYQPPCEQLKCTQTDPPGGAEFYSTTSLGDILYK